MIRKITFLFLFNFSIFQFLSCILINKNNSNHLIVENKWSGETVFFSDVSSEILKQKNINKGWTRLKKNKSIPYFKLKKREGKVLGNYYNNQKEYLVIQLKNGKKYKWKKNYWELSDKAFPSHLSRLKIQNEANKMVGQFIWLNIIDSDTAFINNTNLQFSKFNKKKVISTRIYQNGGRDWPNWLEIYSGNEGGVFVKYNGKEKIAGRQNYYFTHNPLPKIWGKEIIKKIMSGQIEYGMKDQQVRISIGNPNMINNTSSRHSVSEQWIYGKTVGKKKFLLFEYGKLVSM
tara:strand:+ start:586 stop:1452 length:867 start_codon:yes stop_codon:yes gene_type:complete